MAEIKVSVNGKAYPCRQTMGAALRFKRETGREVTDIDSGSLSDMCTYLWCCVVSASKHDGLDFGLSLLDFADSIAPGDILAWAEAVLDDGKSAEDGGGEKKSRA